MGRNWRGSGGVAPPLARYSSRGAAATIPTLKFSPSVHVNYAETVLPMQDGLPKLKDFPTEFGGSGKQIPE